MPEWSSKGVPSGEWDGLINVLILKIHGEMPEWSSKGVPSGEWDGLINVLILKIHGEMPEWSNGTVSKTVVLVTVPRVRIPLSPPD
jgi:hypothetical protein